MSDSVQREWRFYLDDVIEFVENAIAILLDWIRKFSSELKVSGSTYF